MHFSPAFVTPAFGVLVERISRHALVLIVGSLRLPLSFVLIRRSDPLAIFAIPAIIGARGRSGLPTSSLRQSGETDWLRAFCPNRLVASPVNGKNPFAMDP